jgi:class 3 adenylate cyclase/tetratricopeptide (TPR) repeat protein
VACRSCGRENPRTHRFCGGCGTPLSVACGSCGTDLEADDRFCGACGTAVPVSGGAVVTALPEQAAAPRPAPAVPVVAPVDAERRLVSVLFVDLVGFTTLSQDRDPEAVRDLQSAYFDQARTIVARYGGTIEKYIGDAVMAVWGTPIAREDDAERAARAAIDLVGAVTTLDDDASGQALRARAGVVSGEAAVRLAAVGQGMVTGDVVNTASRVQAVADPGVVLVDDVTRAASAGAIAYEPLGEHQLRGRAEPILLFAATQVVAGSGGSQRPDGLEAPFLGRDRDLRLLKELFHETVDRSNARLVLITGAAGVGKSRLGWEFFKYLDGIAVDTYWHVGRCVSYGEGVAFWALADMLRMRLRIAEGDPDEVVVARLDEGLLAHVQDEDERAWLRPRLAVLLGAEEAVPPGVDELSRDSLFAGWRRFIERLAETLPVVLLFEDLQVADTGLLDFLDHLLEWSADRPIFVVGLTRPELHELRSQWSALRPNVSVLSLEPMPIETVARVVDTLVEGLPPATRDALAARAEGLPLFAMETVRMLIDRDIVVPKDGRYVLAGTIDDLGDLDVPPTMQALVAARLDNLSDEERRLVLDVSVLGLSFSPAVVVALERAVGGVAEARVDAVLASLASKGILTIRSDARSPEAGQYRFGQKVMRSVAYATLSRRDRKQRHLAIAAQLVATADRDDLPGVIASHYLDAAAAVPDDADAAALRSTAVEHLERAGRRARSLAASDEAQRYFERALEIATSDTDRARLAELAGLMAHRNGDSEGALERYRIAAAIHEAAGDLTGLATNASHQADALLDLDRSAEALALMTAVHRRVGGEVRDAATARLANTIAIAHVAGDNPEEAMTWLERASVAAEAAGEWEILARTFNVRGILLSLLGDRPVEGLALLKAALDLGLQHDLPTRVALQCGNLAQAFAVRDLEQAERYALEGIRHAKRVGDQFTELFAVSSLAMVRLIQGRWDRIDEEQLREQIRGVQTVYGYGHLALLAALAVWRGDDEAVAALEVDEVPAEDPGVREQQLLVDTLLALHRGDLLAALGTSEEAVGRFGVTGYEGSMWLWPLHATIALELGRDDLVRASVEEAAAIPQGLQVPQFRGFLGWFRARLAAIDGDHELAQEHFEAAEAELGALGAMFWLARVRSDHALWAAERGQDRRARELAEQALDTFTQLGAAPFVGPLERLLEGADAPH